MPSYKLDLVNKMNDPVTPPAPKQPQLILQKIYLKDVSLESPMGIKAFQQEWKPNLTHHLQTTFKRINDTQCEVILTITLNAALGEPEKQETAFIVEVQQAGLFKIQTLDENTVKQLVNVACPTILFPYLREAVDSLLVKAGFPALAIPPINFETLYQQALQEKPTGSAH
jgi:preprotein translocase subunit SecB